MKTRGAGVAFTLAETLITLGIIGIVAMITIPTLIDEHQKIVTVNKLKKNYTLFSQVFQMAERDFDSAKDWDYSLNRNEFTEKYFLPYIPNAKKFNTKYNIMALGGKVGSLYAGGLSADKNLYALPNGTLFGTFNDTNRAQPLAIIVVDLNGIKGPNIVGKDVFHFYIARTTGKLLMSGQGQKRDDILKPVEKEDMIWKSNCAPSNNYYAGVDCGYVIMVDGWKISPDYPW